MKYFALLFLAITLNFFAMEKIILDAHDIELDCMKLKEEQGRIDANKILKKWNKNSNHNEVIEELNELLVFGIDVQSFIPAAKKKFMMPLLLKKLFGLGYYREKYRQTKDTLETLFKLRVNLNPKIIDPPSTFIMRALKENNFLALDWLIEHGALVHKQILNNQLSLSFWIAARNKQHKCIKKLITCGIKIPEKNQRKPLLNLRNQQNDQIKLLLNTVGWFEPLYENNKETTHQCGESIGRVQMQKFDFPNQHYILSAFDKRGKYQAQCRYWWGKIISEEVDEKLKPHFTERIGYIVAGDYNYPDASKEKMVFQKALIDFAEKQLENLQCEKIFKKL